MPLSPPVGSKSSHLSEILSQVNRDSRGSLPVPSSYCIILPLLTQVDLFYTRVTKKGIVSSIMSVLKDHICLMELQNAAISPSIQCAL